jgi:hypothetical protein
LYKGATEEKSASFESRNRSILLARSKLKVRPVPMKITPIGGAPDQGHKTMRAGLGVGWREGEFFNEANFRLAFHDLLDPEYGYTPGAQIQALGVTLRHYRRSDHTRIENLPCSTSCLCSLSTLSLLVLHGNQRSARHDTASQL